MPQEAEIAVLLADISGSTQLYTSLGDVQAREIVARCLAIMRDVTRGHGGTAVKTMGDGVMSSFPSPEAAAEAARAMQHRITGKMTAAGRPIAIHIGVHYGHALIERHDIFGDAVNLLARITEQAKPGQILITDGAVTRLPKALRDACREIYLAPLRGRREQAAIHELVWDATDATLMQAPSAREQHSGTGLLLVRGDWRVTLHEGCPTLTIGRAEQNDLMVPHAVVSRLHACIDCRNGRFVLTDQSANGTYVATDGGGEILVHRDSHVLTGAGILSLGEALVPGSAVQIGYETV